MTIPEIIEEKLRQFNWGNYGLHEFEQSGNREQHEWPKALAREIAVAITPLLASAFTNAVRQGMDIGADR